MATSSSAIMTEAEFLALEGDELEAFAKEVAEAPYSATLESGK
jgi:hypothetical protein